MGNIVGDFLQTLYDMPIEISKKYPGAKVLNYKKIKCGDFDDWGLGASGIYEAYVVNGKDKQVAIIYYKLTIQNRYDNNEDGNKTQKDFNSPIDAIDVVIERIKYNEVKNETRKTK